MFEAPTVADLARRVRLGGVTRAPLRPSVRPHPIALSFAQQRLWFLHQLEGPSPTYNIPLCLRLDGVLNVDALESALNDLISRHESLRTIFAQTESCAHQVILGAGAARIDFQTELANDAALSATLSRAAGYCFDLGMEIPIRARLFKLDDQRYVLLLLIHHIAADGWSLAPLARDLTDAYTARCDGHAPDWKPLPVQYADYALWQRQWLGQETDTGSSIACQIEYWKRTLSGMPEQLALPTDRSRPAQSSYRGDSVAVEVGAEVHQGLVDLARRGGASLFMVLHAVVATLLSRLGAGSDITLGSPIAGRTGRRTRRPGRVLR